MRNVHCIWTLGYGIKIVGATTNNERTNERSFDFISIFFFSFFFPGTDYAPGDVFNAGLDGICPLLPVSWPDAQKVRACEAVCDNATECLGFTYYQVLLCDKITLKISVATDGCFMKSASG